MVTSDTKEKKTSKTSGMTQEEKELRKEVANRYVNLRNKHVGFSSEAARKAYQEKTWQLDKKLQALAGKRFNEQHHK